MTIPTREEAMIALDELNSNTLTDFYCRCVMDYITFLEGERACTVAYRQFIKEWHHKLEKDLKARGIIK